MRQYTTPNQTAKLIELGFEKPKYECLDKTLRGIDKWNNIQNNYSIGELIEMLPTSISDNVFNINFADNRWYVYYGWQPVYSDWRIKYECFEAELIDSLFVMCVKLKEKGVI
jgi:hypothetical protein